MLSQSTEKRPVHPCDRYYAAGIDRRELPDAARRIYDTANAEFGDRDEQNRVRIDVLWDLLESLGVIPKYDEDGLPYDPMFWVDLDDGHLLTIEEMRKGEFPRGSAERDIAHDKKLDAEWRGAREAARKAGRVY